MKRPSLGFIAFLQAFGVIAYTTLIGFFMTNANRWIGDMPQTFLGPALFLTLFAVSAVICSLIFLTYPFLLFWEHKQTHAALRLVLYSTAWLAAFVLAGLTAIALI